MNAIAAPEYHGQCLSSNQVLAVGVVLSCVAFTNPTGSTGATGTSTTHVITADLTQGGAVVGTVQANGTVFQPLAPETATDEVVTDMALADPPTGRGPAIAGINGGYFDNNKNTGDNYTGQPCAGIVSRGVIYKSPAAGYAPTLAVHTDGHLSIGPVDFTGVITDGSDSHALDSINNLADAGPQPTCPKALDPNRLPGSGITMLTPQLGTGTLPGSARPVGTQNSYWIPNAVLVLGHRSGSVVVVDQLQTQFADCSADGLFSTTFCALPELTGNEIGLLGSMDGDAAYGGKWLQDNIAVGDVLTVTAALTDPTIDSLISGGTLLVQDGEATTEPLPGYPPNGNNAETVVGISQDGRTLTMAVIDKDAQSNPTSAGVSVQQAQSFAATVLNAYDAIMLDGGGSSTMVAAVSTPCPGTGPIGVVNDTYTGETQYPPGVCNQRYVGNGLFLYPAAAAPPIGGASSSPAPPDSASAPPITRTSVSSSPVSSSPVASSSVASPSVSASSSLVSTRSIPPSTVTHTLTLTPTASSGTPSAAASTHPSTSTAHGPSDTTSAQSTTTSAVYGGPQLANTGAPDLSALMMFGGLLIGGGSVLISPKRRRKRAR